MGSFDLKVGAKTLKLDTDGHVYEGENLIGGWATGTGNKILISYTDAGTDAVEVGWSFNTKNQLEISQAGQVIATLKASQEGIPTFSLDNNVLCVDPDGDMMFSFKLSCQYGLDGQGNLVVLINDQRSVIDGYISDTQSRFNFQFVDGDMKLYPSSLIFSGGWKRQDGEDKKVILSFALADPGLQIDGAALVLPSEVQVDPKKNHLAMVYFKNGKQRSLQFAGTLEVGRDLTLRFRIADVKEAGLRSTQIEIATTFLFDKVEGTLKLAVGKITNAADRSQVLEIGGKVSAKFKSGRVDWDFSYRKSTSGTGESVVKLATVLAFEGDKTKFMVKYTRDGKSYALDVTAQYSTAKLDGIVGVKVESGGDAGKVVSAFIGISW